MVIFFIVFWSVCVLKVLFFTCFIPLGVLSGTFSNVLYRLVFFIISFVCRI